MAEANVTEITGAELAKQALMRARDWTGELKTLPAESFNAYTQVRLSAGPIIALLARAVYKLANEQNEIGSALDEHQEALEALTGEGDGEGMPLEPGLADRFVAHLAKLGTMIAQSHDFISKNAPDGPERVATLKDIAATSDENRDLIEAVKAAKAAFEAEGDGDDDGDGLDTGALEDGDGE